MQIRPLAGNPDLASLIEANQYCITRGAVLIIELPDDTSMTFDMQIFPYAKAIQDCDLPVDRKLVRTSDSGQK